MANMDTWQQFWYYLANNGSYVLSQFARHFLISIYGVLIAAVIGIPVGSPPHLEQHGNRHCQRNSNDS